jgi:hypothetical protein
MTDSAPCEQVECMFASMPHVHRERSEVGKRQEVRFQTTLMEAGYPPLIEYLGRGQLLWGEWN